MTRRSYGSGSIRARGKDTWQLRVPAGRDPVTGTYRYVSETFHGGKKAAQQRLNELAAQHSGKPPLPLCITESDLPNRNLRRSS